MRRIGAKLGVIPHGGYDMPPNMVYGLSGFALNPKDLLPTATFMTESGHKIWIFVGENGRQFWVYRMDHQ